MALLQGAQTGAEYVGADPLGIVDDPLLRHGVNRRDDGRRRERMTGVGQSTGEDTLIERCRDRVGDDNTTDGDVAGVGALREDDEVGLSRPILPGKPLTGAAKTAHDLIGDPHDAVLVAQGAQALEITGRWHEDARRADHGLEQDRTDGARALKLDDLLEMLQRALRLLLG